MEVLLWAGVRKLLGVRWTPRHQSNMLNRYRLCYSNMHAREINVWRVVPLLHLRALMRMLEKGVRGLELRMRYSKREKDGREWSGGAAYRERVNKRKRKRAALSADSVWFWFTCPPHYTKLKPARGGLEEATQNATRPPDRQTKLDFVLSHTACRSKRRQRARCCREGGCDMGSGGKLKLKII
jgi:hypothetical protein